MTQLDKKLNKCSHRFLMTPPLPLFTGRPNLIRLNQLPVFAARWQRGSKIYFPTFLEWQITKLIITQEPLKLYNKFKHTFRIRKNFDACLTKFKNIQMLLYKISFRFLSITQQFIGLNIPCRLPVYHWLHDFYLKK